MKPTYDCYISLAMHGRLGKDVLEQTEEAKKLCDKYGLTYYCPCDDEMIPSAKIIDKKPNMKRMRWFVRKDFRNLDRSRSIVVLTGDRSSSGVGWEMARMHFKWRRPIVLVAPRMHDRQLTNFTTVLATKICATQLAAFRYLKRRIG